MSVQRARRQRRGRGSSLVSTPGKNRGLRVTAAATGINLALGVLYTWSVFKGSIKQSIRRRARRVSLGSRLDQ